MSPLPSPSPADAGTAPAFAIPSEESELIRATLAGDIQAFGGVVRTHNRRVYNFLYQMTRNRHDAEDLAQQTFIKAYNHLSGFDPRRPLINWLLTIARHSALNHFRDTRGWSEIPDETVGTEPSPAHAAETRDLAASVWDRARTLLSPREFEVMWLRFGESLSIQETAQVAGLTETHVKVIVFRARKALMKGETT